jgi:hypothetical protein
VHVHTVVTILSTVCVFITAGPSTKLFALGGGGYGRTCATRDNEPRPVWTRQGCPSRTSECGGEGDCVKEGGRGEGKCERERALERLRYYSPGHVCVFITAVPNTKLCAWGEEDSGGHVL